MNRRGFLGSMLALGAAPAIVRAESLMKLWVPSQGVQIATLAEVGAVVFQNPAEFDDLIARINQIQRTLVRIGVISA